MKEGLIVALPTDAWGEPIDLPDDMIRLGADELWLVRCWLWKDSVWCRAHAAACGGARWAPDTEGIRNDHPGGSVMWMPAHEAFGTTVTHRPTRRGPPDR